MARVLGEGEKLFVIGNDGLAADTQLTGDMNVNEVKGRRYLYHDDAAGCSPKQYFSGKRY